MLDLFEWLHKQYRDGKQALLGRQPAPRHPGKLQMRFDLGAVGGTETAVVGDIRLGQA